MAHDSVEYPQMQEDSTVYQFTADELKEIDRHIAKYPEKKSAVMPALWIAQQKWGWLPQGAIQLVANTIGMSFAHVYGVASFYTMYLKEFKAKNLIEVCTCFTCGVCGGEDVYKYALKATKANHDGVSEDGQIWFREAECLGACDSAPVVQVNNDVMVFGVDSAKMDKLIADVRTGKSIPYEAVPLRDQSLVK